MEIYFCFSLKNLFYLSSNVKVYVYDFDWKLTCSVHSLLEHLSIDWAILSHDWQIVIVVDNSNDSDLDELNCFLLMPNYLQISNNDLGIFSSASTIILRNKEMKSSIKAFEHLWRPSIKRKHTAISVLEYSLEPQLKIKIRYRLQVAMTNKYKLAIRDGQLRSFLVPAQP